MLGALLWNLFIFAAGAASIVVSTWWWITQQEEVNTEPKKRPVIDSCFPEDLAKKLKGDNYHRRETCLALNLILQFYFQEKRYESGIMRWVTNQLTLEFNELLKHKALSKVIHNMQIRDLNLGTNFPVIKAVTAKHVNLNPDTSVLEQIDIMVEVEYNGGIQLAVDASSRFSKSAMVKIKVVHLSGNGRLQFSRHPFTHWSFSFYEEPQVEFEVYSSLGLHIPRFNSIIISQLKGILKRKHTLPYFKLRGPPLIKRSVQPTNEEGCSVPPGRLTGSVVKCTRLQTALIGEVMYCTVILSEVPIVCAVEKPSGIWAILDLNLKRPNGSSAGILMHNADEGTQMVETVHQASPAFAAGLKKNDILMAVNGTYLNSGQQAAKLFNTNNINGDSNSTSLRVKRLIQQEPKKMMGEQRAVGSDGAATIIGEDTTGDISGSGRSTPDSSHNNSPELKRKLLDLNPLTVDSKASALSQDKSPVAGANKGAPKPTVGANTDKSSSASPQPSERPPSNQSSKAGTPTSPDSAIGMSNLEKRSRRHAGKSKAHFKSIQTPFVDGSCDPVFDSDFEFWLEEENKYLSIAVWGRDITSHKFDDDFGVKDSKDKSRYKDNEKDKKKQKENEKSKIKEEKVLAGLTEDTLLGYVNVPLISIIPETTLNTQGHVTKLLTLNPPHPKCPEMASDPLIPHKGFDKKLCYGDIMLSLTYQPQDRCDSLGRGFIEKSYTSSPISEDESLTDGTMSEEDETLSMQEPAVDRTHDFKRTHFHSATHCDFCRKKIWLKDAYQCGECGIICHKKCMVRCEQETVCDSTGLRYRDSSRNEPQDGRENKDMPEIVTTVVCGPSENGSPGNTPPVSPHASISEGTNPFVVDTDEGDTVETVLDRLLLFPHDEQLVHLARESANDLHSTLPFSERREKINTTLLQLQEAVDREGEVRVDLARQEREASDALARTSVALQISQCDARTQALALLTLHHCTALQYCTPDIEPTDPTEEGNQVIYSENEKVEKS